MKKAFNVILQYLYAIYLGAILGIVGINIYNWEWWVITIPTILLIAVAKIAEKYSEKS